MRDALREVWIHPEAMTHNLEVVRALAPEARVLAFLKANAYGHGLLLAAEALSKADGFAVATLSAAITLRQTHPRQRIVLTSTPYHPSLLATLSEHQIDWVVFDHQQLEGLRAERGLLPIRVWLKIDTGMHRFGFAPEEVPSVLAELQGHSGVHDCVLMGHMACAEMREHPLNAQQIACFEATTQGLGCARSLAKSATLIHFPQASYEWVRPGIMLYGVDPVDTPHAPLDLKPAMTLRGRVIALQRAQAGDPVGYGGDWVAPCHTQLAIVGLGYADGYPRQVASGTSVMIEGKRCQVAGRVSMDVLTVDVGSHAVRVGDWAELWGTQVPVSDVARQAGTTAYACLTHVGERVRRMEGRR